jgi:hypothetical protein
MHLFDFVLQMRNRSLKFDDSLNGIWGDQVKAFFVSNGTDDELTR